MDYLLGLIVGGQRDPYDRHGMVFTHQTLTCGLLMAGFSKVVDYDWKTTIVGSLGIDDYSQAYLPHMDKINGRLMVLNLEAVK